MVREVGIYRFLPECEGMIGKTLPTGEAWREECSAILHEYYNGLEPIFRMHLAMPPRPAPACDVRKAEQTRMKVRARHTGAAAGGLCLRPVTLPNARKI